MDAIEIGPLFAQVQLALGLRHPPRELLTVGVSERVERRPGLRVGVESRCQRLGDLNCARLGVELEGEGDGVARRDSGLLAGGAAETEEVFAVHLRDRRAEHGAVDRGAGRKAFGALADGCDLLVVKHERGCRPARDKFGCQRD